MSVTADTIREKLLTDDRWLARALVALNERQTADERREETVKYRNDRGFRPAHAKRGTGMAQFYLRTGFLTPRQIAWWRARTESGKTRIEIYASQLAKVVEEKQRRAA
jgi:hypothetical protein